MNFWKPHTWKAISATCTLLIHLRKCLQCLYRNNGKVCCFHSLMHGSHLGSIWKASASIHTDLSCHSVKLEKLGQSGGTKLPLKLQQIVVIRVTSNYQRNPHSSSTLLKWSYAGWQKAMREATDEMDTSNWALNLQKQVSIDRGTSLFVKLTDSGPTPLIPGTRHPAWAWYCLLWMFVRVEI